MKQLLTIGAIFLKLSYTFFFRLFKIREAIGIYVKSWDKLIYVILISHIVKTGPKFFNP